MTLPLCRKPGEMVMIGRSCANKLCLLRPDSLVTQAFAFLLGLFCLRHSLRVHAVAAMSNHYHAIVTDTLGRRGDFFRDFHSVLARFLRAIRGVSFGEHVWNGSKPFDAVLLSPEMAMEKLCYVWSNPIKHGIVDNLDDYTGFMVLPKHWGTSLEISCPSKFFAFLAGKPLKIRLYAEPPDFLSHLPIEEAREVGQRALDKFVEDLIAERTEAAASEMTRPQRRRMARYRKTRVGRNAKVKPFCGMACVLEQDPLSPPPNYAPKTRPDGLRRWMGTASEEARAKEAYRVFVERYREALARFKQGLKPDFPPGTVQMVRRYQRLLESAGEAPRWESS